MYIYIFFTLISSIIIFFKISFILVRKDKQKTQKKIIKKNFLCICFKLPPTFPFVFATVL